MSKNIPSLNEKVGSVRNLISNFEKSHDDDDGEKKDIVVEGDSRGIVKEHQHQKIENPYIVTEDSNIVTNLQKNEVVEHNVDTDAELPLLNIEEGFLERQKAQENVDSGSSDQIANILDDYEDSIKNAEKASDDINLVDFDPIGKKQSFKGVIGESARLIPEIASLNDVSSSFYEDSIKTTKKGELAEANQKSVSNEDSSEWGDGGSLIKNFGYQSNSAESNLSNDDNKTLKLEPHIFMENELLADNILGEQTSQHTQEWKYGDIDGLTRLSGKSIDLERAGSLRNPFTDQDNVIVEDSSPPGSKDDGVHRRPSRTRSVSFKEQPQEIYFQEKDSSDGKVDFNPWKYVCYGLLAATLFIYVITLTFNMFFTNSKNVIILAEKDIMEYFEKSSNQTRKLLVLQLSEKYNILGESKKQMKEENGDRQKITYSPRENDSDIKSIVNNFENINPKYQNDVEVKTMMTEDNLKFMFSGVSYAPENVIEPQCGAKLRDVILDIARLSKITGTVKTYGTQCNQADLILQAIDDLKVNMTLALGVWIGNDENTNQQQIADMRSALSKYPREYFHSIFIGNEVIYRNDRTIEQLLSYVKETKEYLKSLNITNLPVGTSEIGSKITSIMFDDCDFVGANIHPFFGGVDAQFGTRWALDYYYSQLVPLKPANKPNSKLIISEIGWPYQGGEFIRSIAGSWEYQQFLNDWLCTTPAEILNDAFFFEAFNEPWKKIWWDSNRTWETEWGFFDSNRSMKKHVYMPDCSKYGNPSAVDFEYIEDVEDPYADGKNED